MSDTYKEMLVPAIRCPVCGQMCHYLFTALPDGFYIEVEERVYGCQCGVKPITARGEIIDVL